MEVSVGGTVGRASPQKGWFTMWQWEEVGPEGDQSSTQGVPVYIVIGSGSPTSPTTRSWLGVSGVQTQVSGAECGVRGVRLFCPLGAHSQEEMVPNMETSLHDLWAPEESLRASGARTPQPVQELGVAQGKVTP